MTRPICTVVGVGPGVGMAVAERFARGGFAVALVGRTAARLDAHRKALVGAGHRAEAFAADAADPAALRRVLSRIEKDLGATDVLVYNAYQGARGRLLDLDPDALRRDLEVNVLGAVAAARAVAPAMRARGRGTVLITGGGLAFKPLPELGSLALGKAALRSVAFTLHDELKPAGVHVAMLTIAGFISPDSHLTPAHIASQFWELHSQPPAQWETERILR
jgi:short-subunit dehydrogenase